MEIFCYWQVNPPIRNFINYSKICLFRQSEFQFDKKVNIFCPYKSAKEAEQCPEYRISKQFYE